VNGTDAAAAQLAVPAPTILACGAWLKNAACLLQGDQVHWSALHGDLDDPANCIALEQSVAALLALADGRIDAVAHDLHPDFFSTRLAQRVAFDLGVPVIAVQHHHAHIVAVMAEHRWQQPVIGLALDGVGLGSDGAAWGGELLLVDPAWPATSDGYRRLGHLHPLALPGGDIAARQPWRMAASSLHALGRGAEIGVRFGPVAGHAAAQTVQTMLERSLRCPATSSAGRWFDAAAGALGICSLQQGEAEAAIALEQLAQQYLTQQHLTQQHLTQHEARQQNTTPQPDFDSEVSDGYVLHADGRLDLRPVLARLFALDHRDPQAIGRGAALFHLTLVDALAHWASAAASLHGIKTVALGGGCFMNRIVATRLRADLTRRGLRVLAPQTLSCGDAALALGQAWVARSRHSSQLLGATA
jgi:hydrogenase maturation protein HypF